MFTILIVVLLLIVIAGIPNFGAHSYGWGPSGVGGLLLVILVLWLLFGSGRVHL